MATFIQLLDEMKNASIPFDETATMNLTSGILNATSSSMPLTINPTVNGSASNAVGSLFFNFDIPRLSVGPVTVFLILFLISLWLWEMYMQSTKDKSSSLPLPPGFMGLPFLGNTPFIIFEPYLGDIFELLYQMFGMVYKMHIVGLPVIRLGGPDNCNQVLNGDNTEPVWPYTVRTLLGSGATSQNSGSIHKAHRRVTMRAFTRQALMDYAPTMQRGCRQELLQWRDSPSEINVFTQSKVLAFKVAWELLVGLSVAGKDAEKLTQDFMDFVGGFIAVPLYFPGTKFYKACKAKETIHQYIGQAIHNSKKNGINHKANCAVDLFLSNTGDDQDMGDIADQDIKDLITELLFAGHETVSSVFTACVMHLNNNPEYLLKLRQYLDNEKILYDKGGDDLTYEKVASLQYAEDIFLESLRVTPPVQGVFRKVLSTFEAGGYQVPSGWSVMAGITETHLHSPFYEHPKSFNPDRWESLRLHNRSALRKHFLSFGAGAHMCLGKDYAKLMGTIFVVELARLCDWSIKVPRPSYTYIPSYRPRDGLPTKFCPRGQLEEKKDQ